NSTPGSSDSTNESAFDSRTIAFGEHFPYKKNALSARTEDRITMNVSTAPVLPFTRADIEGTVPGRFEKIVQHFPDQLALTVRGRRWTYRELNARVNGIAHAIREETHPGVDCVAYLLDHSPEMVMTTLAILKAGKTYLAIHPGTPAAAQEEVVREVNPE